MYNEYTLCTHIHFNTVFRDKGHYADYNKLSSKSLIVQFHLKPSNETDKRNILTTRWMGLGGRRVK